MASPILRPACAQPAPLLCSFLFQSKCASSSGATAMYSTNSPLVVMSRSQRLEKVWVLARRNLSLYLSLYQKQNCEGMILFCEVAVAFSHRDGVRPVRGGSPPDPRPSPRRPPRHHREGWGSGGSGASPFEKMSDLKTNQKQINYLDKPELMRHRVSSVQGGSKRGGFLCCEMA